MTQEEYEAKKAALIEEIERAFDGVEREDGITWHEARVIDDQGSIEERVTARAKDKETRWQDVSQESITQVWDSFWFMDSPGLRYYFPFLLLWDLVSMHNPEDSEDALSLIDSFLIPSPYWKKQQDSYIQKCQIFDPQQSKAIAHYLHFQREALKFYWEQLEPHVEKDKKSSWRRIELDEPDEALRRALDKYWDQFLELPADVSHSGA